MSKTSRNGLSWLANLVSRSVPLWLAGELADRVAGTRGPKSHRRSRSGLSPARRPRLELLELRALMAVDMFVAADAGREASQDRLLVRFEPDAVRAASMAGATLGEHLGFGFYEVQVAAPEFLQDALAFYRGLPGVAYAQQDYVLTASIAPPRDPGFTQLWGLHNTGQTGGTADADIDALEAWDVTTNASSVVVAVLDTGIDFTHPDLAANMWVNAAEAAGRAGVDDDGNGYVDDVHGYDFVNNDGVPMDDQGHGTHVAGTIGAVGNNGIGSTGVAWNARLMGLKFLNSSGSGYTSDAVRAMQYAARMGVQVVNASFGGGGFSQAMYDAIQAFGNQGGIFVAAAGNEAANNDVTPSYPANYDLPNIISVAASDARDRLASFSNYGTSVDIAAPGLSIYSTLPGNAYGSYNGTSMAAPHVAGAAALIKAARPDWTSPQIISALYSSADPVLTSSTRYGRLNLNQAIRQGLVDSRGPRVMQATWSGASRSLSQVEIAFSEAIDPNSFTAADVAITSPTGALIPVSTVAPVANSQNQSFLVSFAQQTQLGSYQATIGPQIQDAAGNQMDQDQDGVQGEATQDQFVTTQALRNVVEYAWSGSVNLVDSNVTIINLDVPTSVTIDDLDIGIDLTHTWVGDLKLDLISPVGTSVTLINQTGSSGDNIQTIFNDEALASITSGSAPFTGEFRPVGLLSSFDGQGLAGRWQLRVSDLMTGDVGVLRGVRFLAAPRADTQGARVTEAQWLGSSPSINQLSVRFSESIDTASFTTADVALQAADGRNVTIQSVTPVDGSNQTRFLITFDLQSTNGQYTATLGPAILDLAGNPLDQDQDGISGESTQDQFVTTTNISNQVVYEWLGNVSLIDAGERVLSLSVPNAVAIADLDVQVQLTHTYVSDLRLILVSPGGTQVTLFDRQGGGGDDLNTTFDDEASLSLTSGSPPFTGSYRPVTPLSALDGQLFAGTWQLRISDLASQDTGAISAVRLRVTPIPDTQGASVTGVQWSDSSSALRRITVNFSEPIDPASFTPSDVVLTGPTGNAISVSGVSVVSGTTSTQFSISFPDQTAAGTYRVVLGPAILDAAGNPMNQDGDGVSGEPTADQFIATATLTGTLTATWTGNLALRDAQETSTSFAIPQNVVIGDINVQVNLLHTWISDLIVILQSPIGTQVRLFNRFGGSGDNLQATFDDEATRPIANGTAPFSGSFIPDRPLAGFDGQTTAGTWSLRVQDRSRGDVGSLRSFSLIITPRVSGSQQVLSEPDSGSTPQPTVPIDSDDTITHEPMGWRNLRDFADVDDDGVVTPIDALRVINELNNSFNFLVPSGEGRTKPVRGYIDTSGDDRLTPLDALLVINAIRRSSLSQAEGEARAHAVDEVMRDWSLGQLDELARLRRPVWWLAR